MGKSKNDIKVTQFIDLAKFVYNNIENSLEHKYIKEKFYLIMVILLDNQLSKVQLEKRLECLSTDSFFIRGLEETRNHIISNICLLGVMRGMKFSMLSGYYLKPSKIKKILLQKVI